MARPTGAGHCGVVTILNSGYRRTPRLMHLLWCLFVIRAHFQFTVRAVHVLGVENTAISFLSCLHRFWKQDAVGPRSHHYCSLSWRRNSQTGHCQPRPDCSSAVFCHLASATQRNYQTGESSSAEKLGYTPHFQPQRVYWLPCSKKNSWQAPPKSYLSAVQCSHSALAGRPENGGDGPAGVRGEGDEVASDASGLMETVAHHPTSCSKDEAGLVESLGQPRHSHALDSLNHVFLWVPTCKRGGFSGDSLFCQRSPLVFWDVQVTATW